MTNWFWNRLAALGAAGLLIAAWISPVSGAGDPGAVTLEAKLDGKAEIQLKNVTLREAFDRIEQKTGIVFSLDSARGAIELLPYGEQTQISATLEGMAWRAGIRDILKPLALTYELGENQVYILGTKELSQQPKRLGLEELNAIVKLQQITLTRREEKILRQIEQVSGISFGVILNGERRKELDDDIAETILTNHPQRATEVLDLYANRCGKMEHDRAAWSWYVRGGEGDGLDIVFLPAKEISLMKLERRVTREFKNVPLQTILQELTEHAGMTAEFQPGCIGMLDESVRNRSSLVIRGGTVRSALEALEGLTGLAYDPYDLNRLRFSAGEGIKNLSPDRPMPTTSTNPTLGSLSVKVPGTDLETMIVIREQMLRDAGVWEKYQQMRQDNMKEFLEYLKNYTPAPADEKKN